MLKRLALRWMRFKAWLLRGEILNKHDRLWELDAESADLRAWLYEAQRELRLLNARLEMEKPGHEVILEILR